MSESAEQSVAFVEQLASFFNYYPMMWVLYGCVLMLPALIFISCLWPKKKVDSTAQRKKTDAPSPDDNVASEMTRERGASERGTQAQGGGGVRERQPRQEPASSLSTRNEPNRTITVEDREAEVHVERDRSAQEDAVVSNGTVTVEEREVEVAEGERDCSAQEPAIVSNGSITAEDETVNIGTTPMPSTKVNAESAPVHNGGIVENGYHDDDPVVENGVDEDAVVVENGEVESEDKRRWSFPPVLDDFNLMESDADPTDLEAIFADDRLKEIELHIQPDSPGLGISIVGGSGSPSGDLPILIKRVLPKSLAEEDGRLKQGDELVAVNDTLLVGMNKDFAINALSNMHGDIRLLVLQED